MPCCWRAARRRCAGNPRSTVSIRTPTGRFKSWSSNRTAILIGGDFTTISPNGGVSVTRNRIARLNHDGALDTAFNPNANGTVFAITVQTDGKILVGGFFSTIGGLARTNIARLDATTGLADSFNPNANNGVASIVVQSDGRILAGGAFTSIGGQTRNRIARLDATTGSTDSFDPNANNLVLVNRSAAGWQNSGGRRFHQHGRTDAQ